TITDPAERAEALTGVAKVLGAAGQPQRALAVADAAERASEAVVHGVAHGLERRQRLHALAAALSTAPYPTTIAPALRIARWTTPLATLARVAPAALATIVDERLTTQTDE